MMDILINNELYKEVNDIDYFKQALLSLIDVQYSPLQALKVNMFSFFDLIEDFCKTERETKKGEKKAELTREITKINDQRKFWKIIRKRETFIQKYYDYILGMEKLDPLRGFGMSNSFGDKVRGNPELQRISFKHV